MKRVRPPAQRLRELRAWARTVACCPTCQVEPTVPCHLDGRALADGSVHAARYAEADRTAS